MRFAGDIMDSEKDGLLKPPVNASAVNSSTYHPLVLVVISHYNAWSSDQLIALLDQMWTVPAGYPFQTRVVVNRAEPHELALPSRYQSVEVVYRENVGFNIRAWEQGWREPPVFDAYLFLQEECQIVRPGWLRAFVQASKNSPSDSLVRASAATILGSIWRATLQYAESYRIYREFFEEHRTPMGHDAAHLQSAGALRTARAPRADRWVSPWPRQGPHHGLGDRDQQTRDCPRLSNPSDRVETVQVHSPSPMAKLS